MDVILSHDLASIGSLNFFEVPARAQYLPRVKQCLCSICRALVIADFLNWHGVERTFLGVAPVCDCAYDCCLVDGRAPNVCLRSNGGLVRLYGHASLICRDFTIARSKLSKSECFLVLVVPRWVDNEQKRLRWDLVTLK